jgi:hypothetical protein
MTTETEYTAEIVPFPVRAQRNYVGFVIAEFQRRRGDKQKAAYADAVIQSQRRRLTGLGVSPDRIAAEVRSLESLFFGQADVKAGAA